MKTNGSSLMSAFSIVANSGQALALAVLAVSTMFLTSCAHPGSQPQVKSTGHVARINGKATIKASTGQLCHQFSPLYADVPSTGKTLTLTVWLRADRVSTETVISEPRSFVVLASGPSNLSQSFTFNHTPPSTGSYPLWWSVPQSITIPGVPGGSKRYFFSTTATVRFSDDMANEVSSTLCSEGHPIHKRTHARRRVH